MLKSNLKFSLAPENTLLFKLASCDFLDIGDDSTTVGKKVSWPYLDEAPTTK